MHAIGCPKSASQIPALIFVGLLLGNAPTSAQNPMPQTQSPASSKPARHDSVEVVEHLSPEEVEEGKFNDLCESVAQLQRKGTCTTEIIERYQSEVIPPAEKSKFNVPKNKFLFSPTATSAIVTWRYRHLRKPNPPSRKSGSTLPSGQAPTIPPIPSISAKSQRRRWASSIGQKPNNRS